MTRRLIVTGALLAVLGGERLEAQPLSIDQFTARIDGLVAAVRVADSAEAVRIARSVPSAERVASGGETLDVPLQWLRTALESAPADGPAWPERRRRLLERLEAVSAEARLVGESARGDDASARRELTAVLADRRFALARRTSWQTVLRNKIRDWLSDLLLRTAARGWSGRRIVTTVAWAVSGAAVIVLLIWLTRVSLRRRAERPIGVGPVDMPAPPGRVLGAQAAELIRAGRVREGAQAAYRAALRRLEEEGVVRPDAASTPRETLRRVARSHRRAAPLAAITGVFERLWYGSRPAGDDDAPRLLALLREFECLPSDRAK